MLPLTPFLITECEDLHKSKNIKVCCTNCTSSSLDANCLVYQASLLYKSEFWVCPNFELNTLIGRLVATLVARDQTEIVNSHLTLCQSRHKLHYSTCLTHFGLGNILSKQPVSPELLTFTSHCYRRAVKVLFQHHLARTGCTTCRRGWHLNRRAWMRGMRPNPYILDNESGSLEELWHPFAWNIVEVNKTY
jgi:hypothetical protein